MVEKSQKKDQGLFFLFVISELAWGCAWAAALQFTRAGRYLANRRTWVTVVVGVGGTLVIALPVVPLKWLVFIAGAFGLSSIGIISRSLYNEFLLERALGGNAENESAAVGTVGWRGDSR